MASIDDIWLVDFGEPFPGEPAHHRPAVVLGPPETFGPRFPFVIVCPLSTTPRGLSLHVEVDPTEVNGLDEVSYIQCELIRSISNRRLIHRLGTIDAAVAQHVDEIVKTLLNH